MPPTSGLTFVLRVEDSGSPGTYNLLAGQRGTTLNRGTDTVDASDKDSPGWPAELATKRTWSIDVEGNVAEADAALLDLEDAWDNMASINVRIVTPGANNYTGPVTVQNFTFEGPHDGIFSYSITLVAFGQVTKT